MNLAEIRKKALQEREAGGITPASSSAVSAPASSHPVREDPTGTVVTAIPVELAAPGVEEFPERQPTAVVDAIAAPAPAMSETVPMHEPLSFPGTMSTARPFDPIAELLAGRELAGSEDEDEHSSLIDGASSLDQIEEYLCFRVADENYAINIMEIKEIIKPREVTEVPRVPSFVRGVLSLRGIIIPIFDMRVRLGLPGSHASERERVIVGNRAATAYFADIASRSGWTISRRSFECLQWEFGSAPFDVAGTFGDNSGILSGASTPVLDTSVKASGNSSLRFISAGGGVWVTIQGSMEAYCA